MLLVSLVVWDIHNTLFSKPDLRCLQVLSNVLVCVEVKVYTFTLKIKYLMYAQPRFNHEHFNLLPHVFA